jgi:hypothetical protein
MSGMAAPPRRPDSLRKPSVFDRVGIVGVYCLAAGRSALARDAARVQVRCPRTGHEDRRPSCTLYLTKDVWKCHACAVGGGKADLIVAAGRADTRAAAALWLEEQLGLTRSSAPRRIDAARTAPDGEARSTTKGEPADVRQALAIEATHYRERCQIEGELLTNEANAIRDSVARRYRIRLRALPRPPCEGGFGGRERDRVWAAVFEWALFVASVQLLGAPVAFDDRLLPPRMVLLAAEDLAAAAMRSIECEARRGGAAA